MIQEKKKVEALSYLPPLRHLAYISLPRFRRGTFYEFEDLCKSKRGLHQYKKKAQKQNFKRGSGARKCACQFIKIIPPFQVPGSGFKSFSFLSIESTGIISNVKFLYKGDEFSQPQFVGHDKEEWFLMKYLTLSS